MTELHNSADIGARIKRALTEDLRESRLSRADIAIRLSGLAGRTITEHHLDAFAAESKQGYRFPAELIAAWTEVTGSRRVLDLVCAAAGYHAADETERDLAALGRAQIQRERLDKRLEELKGNLWTRA